MTMMKSYIQLKQKLKKRASLRAHDRLRQATP